MKTLAIRYLATCSTTTLVGRGKIFNKELYFLEILNYVLLHTQNYNTKNTA